MTGTQRGEQWRPELPARDALVWRPAASILYRGLRLAFRSHWSAEGLEHFDDVRAPFLVATNHASLVDTPCLQRVVPQRFRRRLAVVGALDMFGTPPGASIFVRAKRWPLTRFAVAGHHAILVKRPYGSPDGVRRVTRLMESGWSFIIYPEGTRSRDGSVGPFRAGVAAFARLCRCPVVPGWIEGSANVYPVGRIVPVGGPIRVRFGAALAMEEGESDDAFTERLRASILALKPAERA